VLEIYIQKSEDIHNLIFVHMVKVNFNYNVNKESFCFVELTEYRLVLFNIVFSNTGSFVGGKTNCTKNSFCGRFLSLSPPML